MQTAVDINTMAFDYVKNKIVQVLLVFSDAAVVIATRRVVFIEIVETSIPNTPLCHKQDLQKQALQQFLQFLGQQQSYQAHPTMVLRNVLQ